ncbi:uncharacterized protein MELLADRAFT_102320 [Melampsora larici-populina 98AG31]|uniref:Uncharacterized protein n=1 Tax=Melampsora larici-populina (strain 98AG31 / pathotype 3-4-7) TaxID=747676 RepID=F4R7X0_MELLP|nr:uncharacterized protein MELLADRAFT_102320 [Melampsora larici-populina 98AG31]EGG11716.1 hypothetical protein MELLADRAFT_102320 [Melampsora larici-populina 98AG31]
MTTHHTQSILFILSFITLVFVINISSNKTRLCIVKLDDDNYPEWKGNIIGALMLATLDEFMDSEATPVTAPTELPVPLEQKVLCEAYVIRQHKAAGIIKFQATTSGSKGRAYSSFTQITYQSLVLYIKDTQAALETMHACGIKFSYDPNKIISETIVGKLPNSMETMISILDSKRPLKTKIVLDTLDSYLVKYKEHHCNNNNSIALATLSNQPPAWQSGRRFPYPTCTNGVHNPAVRGHKPEVLGSTSSSLSRQCTFL